MGGILRGHFFPVGRDDRIAIPFIVGEGWLRAKLIYCEEEGSHATIPSITGGLVVWPHICYMRVWLCDY
jgi:small neutral amino acid transporter SnatA (MarC family)